MMKAVFLAGAVSIGASINTAQADMPVMIGGDPDYDACGGSGVVTGLNPNGDGFLAVRSGPGTRFVMLDKIHNGHPIFFCDERGNWIGIVYSWDEGVDCGVGSPVSRRQTYNGPCRSGWVHRRYVQLLAG